MRKAVTPKTMELIKSSDLYFGRKGLWARWRARAIMKLAALDRINRLVCDIEKNAYSIPVLIRKYLQLNSSVLGFNTDHEFCDSLDALMLLDLKKVPEETILMLSKELADIDVLGRFKHIVD